VVQRGNNRTTVFGDTSDYRFFLSLLRHESARCSVAIHAYALMTNHFHLMVTPSDRTGLSTMMQSVGRTYVPAFNSKHRRTGGLWEGRYRSFVIESEGYWLKCMRSVELNPVRAGIVGRVRAPTSAAQRTHCSPFTISIYGLGRPARIGSAHGALSVEKRYPILSWPNCAMRLDEADGPRPQRVQCCEGV
jgi:REP element-mobilizing transposase RayT